MGSHLLVEGMSGTGKTTLAHGICARLQAHGHSPVYNKSLPCDGLSKRVLTTLGFLKGISPALHEDFFAFNVYLDLQRITRLSRNGGIVVQDRGLPSYVAYNQIVQPDNRGVVFKSYVEERLQKFVPTLTVYLTADADTRRGRMLRRQHTSTLAQKDAIEFTATGHRLEATLENYARSYSPCIVIDTGKCVQQDVVDRVFDELQRYM